MTGPRLDRFQALLRRPRCLPVSSSVKHSLYRTTIIPQLLWGFWWNPRSADAVKDFHKLTTLVKRALDVVQQGSRDLWLPLDGRGFALRMTSAAAFFKADVFWRGHGRRLITGRWGLAVTSFLQDYEFDRTGAHIWQHAVVGDFDLSGGDVATIATRRCTCGVENAMSLFCKGDDTSLQTSFPMTLATTKTCSRRPSSFTTVPPTKSVTSRSVAVSVKSNTPGCIGCLFRALDRVSCSVPSAGTMEFPSGGTLCGAAPACGKGFVLANAVVKAPRVLVVGLLSWQIPR